MSSSDTPMMRQPGMNPALARCSSPGMSLRRDRSPVAPNSTTTCGYLGPTPARTFATEHLCGEVLPHGRGYGPTVTSAPLYDTVASGTASRSEGGFAPSLI